MSDYTAYVRGQMEARNKSQTGRFMKDGFDKWAESSTPARAGQMEKEPAPSTNTMSRDVGSAMSQKFLFRQGYGEVPSSTGGVLPLLAAAPYVLPAAAGLATGIYAGVKGERKVQKMRQQIAKEERAKRGGILPLLPAAAVAAAPYVLPAAAGFATGIYAGVKGQRKVDSMRQQIAREERAKYGGAMCGMGFREGVRETQNVYGNLADAAVYGYDAYESAKKGVTGLPGALRSGAQVAESVLKVKDSAKKAADEFASGSGRASEVAKHALIPGYSQYQATKTLVKQVKSATGKGKTDGRAARAAIVKQVMAQRGVKMIEASKIVKAEGLY